MKYKGGTRTVRVKKGLNLNMCVMGGVKIMSSLALYEITNCNLYLGLNLYLLPATNRLRYRL